MPGPVQPRRLALVAVIAATLAVFGAVIGFVSWQLRSGLRAQILQREAATLTEVADLQLTTEADALAKLGIADAPGELLNAVLRTSKLRGVFAVRVFDAARHFAGALPLPWSEEPPSTNDWDRLLAGRPVARLHPRSSAAEVVGLVPGRQDTREDEPLIETWLPLKRVDSDRLVGAAQLWTDGRSILREFELVDRRLLTQGLLAWLGGSILIGVLVGWAFGRLASANRQLLSRTKELARANRELTLAAKTSALGALAAHLVHELKNPIAGLEEFVALQGGRQTGSSELAAATELTQRLRTLVNDVVGVMRDEQVGDQYELTGSEIASVVATRAAALGSARGVSLVVDGVTTKSLAARRANLAALVCFNLVQNAIEASASGNTVELRVAATAHGIDFLVTDRAGGLPDAVRARLFQPCQTTKPGGSGLGLALSQQLARQAGGIIELVQSETSGTIFRLRLAFDHAD